MRKLFLVLALFTMSFVASAQESALKARSVYDVNQDDKVSISDVPHLIQKLNGQSTVDKTVVDTEKLLEVLAELKQQYTTILSELANLNTQIASLQQKLGLVPGPTELAHEYVDLGLSVKWATCNVGAEKPEDAGLYFAWGEAEGYTADTSDGRMFDCAHYKWMDHTINNWKGYTKYTCKDGQTGTKWYTGVTYIGTEVDGTWYKNLTTLLPEDDAATANWGGSWRMPTDAELTELRTNCTWTWDSTKKGYKVTSKKNDNSIFLPAAGSRGGSDLTGAGSVGNYWSSSLCPDYSNYAFNVTFTSSNVNGFSFARLFGQSIRPVCP